MAIFRAHKTSFAGGEVSPAMQARVDLERHASSLKVGRNIIIHPTGGVSNRAGTELVSFLPPAATHSLQIPFVINPRTDQTYMLILTEGKMWFTRNGAPVVENTEVFDVSDSAGQALFTSHTITQPHGYSNGDFVVFRSTLAAVPGAGIQRTVPGLDTRMFEVREVSGHTLKLWDLARNRVVYFSEANHLTGANQAEVFMQRRYSIDTPWSGAELAQLTYAQDNHVMYFANPQDAPRKLTYTADTNWALGTVSYGIPGIIVPIPTVARTTGTGHVEANVKRFYYQVVSVLNDGRQVSATSARVSNDLERPGAMNTISWTALAGRDRYEIYKDSGTGTYGYIGQTTGTSFIDQNIAEDTSHTPPVWLDPFNGANKYPRSITIHEQRLMFASTNEDPHAIYGTQIGNFESLTASSPARDDDAIEIRVRDKQTQAINALVSTPAGLALFGSASEMMLTGGDSNTYLTPTNPVVRPQSRRGSGNVQPLAIGDILLYAQARGGVIRDFVYDVAQDSFVGPDRTILARHLFEGRKIVSWAYAQAPDSIVWVAMDDGALLSLTYLREHDIWGWTRHDTAKGKVQSVATLPEGDEDVLYLTVERTIRGRRHIYHERMATRTVSGEADWFFADCALRYKGAAVSTITGLDHLEGEDLAILADGYVLSHDRRVIRGSLDLGGEYANVLVGLRYTSEIETLDLDEVAAGGVGATIGRAVSFPKVVVKVQDTRGIVVGPSIEQLTAAPLERDIAGRPMEYTGKFEMMLDNRIDSTGSIIIMQTHPLPMTILAVAPDVSFGG